VEVFVDSDFSEVGLDEELQPVTMATLHNRNNQKIVEDIFFITNFLTRLLYLMKNEK